jgi:CRP-like cAMP-binding protein
MDVASAAVWDSFQNGGVLATLSYVLLIASMMMSRVSYLRLLAVASGACGVLYFWVFLGDRVASIWEMLFIAANLFQLAVTAYRDRMSRFDPDQMLFRTIAVPGLAPSEAHRLLRIARIDSIDEGTVLTREGEAASQLVFILDGEVAIRVADKEVARCRHADFIGEISVVNGSAATASAVAASPVRYIGFDATALRAFMEKHERIGHELQLAFRSGLREKLVRANQALAQATA